VCVCVCVCCAKWGEWGAALLTCGGAHTLSLNSITLSVTLHTVTRSHTQQDEPGACSIDMALNEARWYTFRAGTYTQVSWLCDV
jgi:hypothetical protein